MSPLSTVLLLSDDAMTLALLGLLVELADFVPAFAEEGERPEDALSRVRPAFVVVLDDTIDAARSDLFFARAAQRKVGLAIFSGKGSARDLADGIGARGIPYFALPTDVDNLARIIRTAATTAWWQRGVDRRALPAAEREDEGGLFFVDRSGRRWRVHDRRGSDRRQTPDGVGVVGDGVRPRETTRVFESDGDSVSTRLADGELGMVSAGELEEQFLRGMAG